MKVSKKAPAPEVSAKRMLNVREAATYLGATVWFVRSEVWAKRLRSVMFGNRLLFDRGDLDAFIERAKASA